MKYLVFVERENLGKDLSFMQAMERALAGIEHRLIFYRATQYDFFASLDPQGRLYRLPSWLGRPLQTILLILHPGQWHHYFNESIPKRSRRLGKFVRRLQARGDQVSIIGRSAGARLASLVADQVGAEKLICLGYPFRHPGHSVEPERYLHLADLKTPTLIFQGDRDIYGGLDVAGRYELSPAIRIGFFQTDHDFSLSESDWQKMIREIKAFLAE